MPVFFSNKFIWVVEMHGLYPFCFTFYFFEGSLFYVRVYQVIFLVFFSSSSSPYFPKTDF